MNPVRGRTVARRQIPCDGKAVKRVVDERATPGQIGEGGPGQADAQQEAGRQKQEQGPISPQCRVRRIRRDHGASGCAGERARIITSRPRPNQPERNGRIPGALRAGPNAVVVSNHATT